MLLTEGVHRLTALPDRQIYTWGLHVHVTSRGNGSLWPQHLCPVQMQRLWTQWNQSHRRHKPRNIPAPSGWSGPHPPRKPLTRLQSHSLKCPRRRAQARDPARAQRTPSGAVGGWHPNGPLGVLLSHRSSLTILVLPHEDSPSPSKAVGSFLQ